MSREAEYDVVWNEPTQRWLVFRSDGTGGRCAAERIELIDTLAVSQGRALRVRGELLVNGATMAISGQDVATATAKIRRVIAKNQVLHIPVVRAQAISRLGGRG